MSSTDPCRRNTSIGAAEDSGTVCLWVTRRDRTKPDLSFRSDASHHARDTRPLAPVARLFGPRLANFDLEALEVAQMVDFLSDRGIETEVDPAAQRDVARRQPGAPMSWANNCLASSGVSETR